MNVSMWLERLFISCDAKDIRTLYLIFALFSGLLGTAFSVLIRLELSGPGVQYIADNQLYYSIVTPHAILMIFFMVIPAILGLAPFNEYLIEDLMNGLLTLAALLLFTNLWVLAVSWYGFYASAPLIIKVLFVLINSQSIWYIYIVYTFNEVNKYPILFLITTLIFIIIMIFIGDYIYAVIGDFIDAVYMNSLGPGNVGGTSGPGGPGGPGNLPGPGNNPNSLIINHNPDSNNSMRDAWRTAYEAGARTMTYTRADGEVVTRLLPPHSNNITYSHQVAIHQAISSHLPRELYARVLVEYIKDNGLGL